MKKIAGLFLCLGILISSCNMQANSTPDPQIATAAALTVQAAINAAPLASPTAGDSAIGTATSAQPGTPAPTKTSTPTITPTYSTPILTIKESTNCRVGPGQAFVVIFTFLPGTSAEIVGQYPTDNYWIVKLPDSNDTCWIWGEYATATGSYWVVPTVTVPPTATASPPERPGSIHFNYECPFGNLTTVLNWDDNADNETGYRVYRDDQLIAELPANSNTYIDNTTTSGSNITYSVEAFNDAGVSERRSIGFSCQ